MLSKSWTNFVALVVLSSLPRAMTSSGVQRPLPPPDLRDRPVECSEPADDLDLECRSFQVPLDWANPELGSGHIYYTRYPAVSGVPRKGTLFIDTGASFTLAGAYESRYWYSKMASTLTGGQYDIVTWDVRGAGGNRTVPALRRCFDDDWERHQFYAQTSHELGIEPVLGSGLQFVREQGPEDAKNWLLLQSRMIDHCMQQQDPEVLRHVGTASTVRDLIAMTDAFDGQGSPVNFWTMWSGFRIGRHLLQMFPERAGRVVLTAPNHLDIHQGENGYDLWVRDVQHANNTLARFVEHCAGPTVRGCYYDTHNALVDGMPSSYIRLMLLLARSWLVGWYTASEVELNNTALTSAFGALAPMDSKGPSPTEMIMGLNYFLSFHDALDIGVMPIMCGDHLNGYDPADSSRRNLEIASRLGQDMYMAPLIMKGVFPPLQYLCHLWPVRAAERISTSVPPLRTVAHPPLVVQYASDPLAKVHPIDAIVPGIHGAKSILQMGYATHSFNPESCLARVVGDYLRDGTIPQRAWCDADRGQAEPPEIDSGPPTTTAEAGSGIAWRKFTAESAWSAELALAGWVLAVVALASAVLAACNVLSRMHVVGEEVVRLEGDEILKSTSSDSESGDEDGG